MTTWKLGDLAQTVDGTVWIRLQYRNYVGDTWRFCWRSVANHVRYDGTDERFEADYRPVWRAWTPVLPV